jgi:hypothetical protein
MPGMHGARRYEQTQRLSGSSYVMAVERCPDAGKLPTKFQLRIVADRNCEHVETVCTTSSCVQAWQRDWKLIFKRTGGGRRLAERLGIALD